MSIFTRLLIAFSFMCAAVIVGSNTTDAAFVAPRRDGASSGQRIDVDDVLKITTHNELLDTAIQKLEAISGLLARAADERSAREVCSAAERAYIELELISIRMTMLPTPTAAERVKLQGRYERFTAARLAVQGEVARIAEAPPLAAHLRAVMFPLHGQIKQVRAQQGNSLTSQLQTVRSTVELYRLQHRDDFPDFRRHGWNQLTGKTSDDGTITPRGQFGPYLQSAPRNPLTGNSRILIVRGVPARDFRYAKGDCGFVLDEASGRFWALDAQGRVFNENPTAQASTE